MNQTDVLVIGAGHAGVAAATELRRAGFAGQITLVGDEEGTPYQRPPLSKAWLKGIVDEESGWLQPPGFFGTNGLVLVPGKRIEVLDPERGTARANDGTLIGFTYAVIATGAVARPLRIPGADNAALLQLRTAADARQLRDLISRAGRLAVIGGGFIGLEVAATATQLGASVCIIERESRVLGRLGSEFLSAYLADLHRQHGVEIIVDADVFSIEEQPNPSLEVRLGDGRWRVVDHVLAAIGAVPNDDLARSAGITCSNGIMVDAQGRTSEPNFFAIGDVARRPLLPFAESVRLESVHNANEQARMMAAAITGGPVVQAATPWFWSDQFDCKLQIAGLLPPDPETEVRGSPSSGSFALLHRKNGRLVCIEAVNSSREFALGRRAITAEAKLVAAPHG